jgi:hypothetical protein
MDGCWPLALHKAQWGSGVQKVQVYKETTCTLRYRPERLGPSKFDQFVCEIVKYLYESQLSVGTIQLVNAVSNEEIQASESLYIHAHDAICTDCGVML